MSEFIQFVSVTLFLVISIFGSRCFYYLYLMYFSNGMMKKYNFKLKDLKYSFEEITYFVTLPSNNPLIASASRRDLYAEKEFISLLFPSIKGLKIIVRNQVGEEQFIAYLARENFRLPLLDKLIFQGKIDQATYDRINSYKLMHPSTVREILNEVHNQLHHNKYL